MSSFRIAGTQLAARHATAADVDTDRSLIGYAESPRAGDWTLRSALVRLAQPHPELAGAVLESVRRCDGALRPYARELLRHGTTTDRGLSIGDEGLADPSLPTADARVADLARVAREYPEHASELFDSYRESIELDDEEVLAVPLLVVALDLDTLADVVTDWANVGPANPPVAQIEALAKSAFEGLGELGIEREGGPP